MARSNVRHLVLEANWRRVEGHLVPMPGDSPYMRVGDGLLRLPGVNPVASFYTPTDAANFARKSEAEVRRRVGNPFAVLGPAPAAQTTMPEPVFRDYLMDLGLEPPAGSWADWWEKRESPWTGRQEDGVWQALDRVRVYGVVSAAVAYAVVEVPWAFWPYSAEYTAGTEGGRVVGLFRSEERAKADRDRRASARRQERFWDGHDMSESWDRPTDGCRFNWWSRATARAFGDPRPICLANRLTDEVPLFEVVEIPFHAGKAGAMRATVVLRDRWNDGLRRPVRRQCGVPEAAFVNRAAVVADRDERTRQARSVANPFRYAVVADGLTDPTAADDFTLALMEQDIPPPAAGWVDWWDAELTDAGREVVWELLPGLPFYTMIDVELDAED